MFVILISFKDLKIFKYKLLEFKFVQIALKRDKRFRIQVVFRPWFLENECKIKDNDCTLTNSFCVYLVNNCLRGNCWFVRNKAIISFNRLLFSYGICSPFYFRFISRFCFIIPCSLDSICNSRNYFGLLISLFFKKLWWALRTHSFRVYFCNLMVLIKLRENI